MESEAQILLDDAIAFCQRDGQSDRLVNMLRQSTPVKLDEDSLHIEAPSRFAVTFLEKNKPVVEAYLEEIAFMPISLVVLAPAGAGAGAATGTVAGAATGTVAGTVAGGGAGAGGAVAFVEAEPFAGAGEAAESATNLGVDARIAVPEILARETIGQSTSFIAEPAHNIEKTADQTGQVGQAGHAAHAGGGNMPFAPAGDRGGVNVTNTMSRDQFMRMFAQMKGADTGRPADKKQIEPAATTAVSPQNAPKQGASSPVRSKFTFDNFVYGDENRLAYHSAMRFCAFVEEPSQCNSLFLYGGSGLGKTHLLLAIKNYLATEKPHIKVKYANSQAYIDDFINEISQQKTEGRSILREYHEADVLIIDDIQQVANKQASVEYFFSLMDEFIRENKKVALASDRAPKELNMDERLTSRFNAGTLCLVSEPGFEMKYMILKHYYENTIKGRSDINDMNIDPSLLGAFQANDGTLTDEHLRHMAEISGNNIRDLEGCCERCASLSFEREQQGRTLTMEDIEHVVSERFRTAQKVIRIDTVQDVVATHYGLEAIDLKGTRRTKDIAFARHIAVYLSNSLCEMSSSAIGAEFGGRDHSTVLNSIKVVESKMKEDRRICDELRLLEDRIKLQQQDN